MKKKVKITKEMTIGEVLNYNPNASQILMGFGMFCCSCPGAQQETLEEASMVHGIDLELLVKKLNEK